MSDTFSVWVQSRLTSHGFACGPIDGDIGPLTTSAIRAFQSARGLAPTGTATAETVQALRATTAGPTVPLPPTVVSPPAVTPWPKQSGVSAFFGNIGTRQTILTLPWPMRLAWNLSQVVTRVSCHSKVAPSAFRVLDAVGRIYSPKERSELGLDIFSGCLNVRKMRGSATQWSMHSWGIAFDFDNTRNDLRWGSQGREASGKTCPIPRLSHADCIPFWEEWEKEGWLSLGRSRNYDWMHVQAAML